MSCHANEKIQRDEESAHLIINVDKYSKDKRIAYIHFRNVNGKVPNYVEAFVDDGDINMVNVIKILKRNNYDGVIIPDHTPALSCSAPWHSGMAYAVGYIKGLIKILLLLEPMAKFSIVIFDFKSLFILFVIFLNCSNIFGIGSKE